MQVHRLSLCFFLFLSLVMSHGGAEELLPSFASFVQGVNVVSGLPEGDCEAAGTYENYREGWNALGGQSIFLAEGDFRIGKVKVLHPEAEGGDSDLYFTYEEGETRVYQMPGRLSIYRFSGALLVEEVEHHQLPSSGAPSFSTLFAFSAGLRPAASYLSGATGYSAIQAIPSPAVGPSGCFCSADILPEKVNRDSFSCRERYLWDETQPEPCLKAWVLDDAMGEEVLACSFVYEERGETEAPPSHSPILEGGETASSSLFPGFDYLQHVLYSTLPGSNGELPLPPVPRMILETSGKAFLGESIYLLMGPRLSNTYVGVCGEHELYDKVRVTFINGILTTEDEILDGLNALSASHGGVRVHYVFRPTSGWTWDIFSAIRIKTGFLLAGFRSTHARLLAQMWRDLIQEMGGVGGGGTIVHYAHSLGGTDTDRARDLLTPEEQKMIRVISFGSSTLIREGGFQSVVNVVSRGDGVSCFDTLEYLRSCLYSRDYVSFHGSFFGVAWPTDHLFNGPTYSGVLRSLGEQFLLEFRL